MVTSTPTKKPTSDGLNPESLDRIDLRTISQSDLYTLSLCSSSAFDLRPTNNLVIPEIDRRIFNESAATRGQTHSRHRTNSSAVVGRRVRLPGASVSPSQNDPSLAEGKSVIRHLKRLISEAELKNPPTDQPQSPSPANTQIGNFSGVTSVCEEIGIVGFSGERKRKRRSRKNSRQSKPPPSPAARIGGSGDVGGNDFGGERKRKRKRAEKEVCLVEGGGEIELEIVNKNGVVVDLRGLENGDEVFDEELKKRTIGLESEEEFLRFMGGLEGKWGSTRKKRRIVESGEFSDALPVGWKLLLALKRRQFRPFLFCRRFISPNGKEFLSCKEAAQYLQSYFGLDDPSQQSSQTENAVVERSAGHVEADQNAPNGTPDSVSPRLPPDTTTPSGHPKELTLEEIRNLPEVEVKDAIECYQCKISFDEIDELYKHLMTFHKRTTRMYSPDSLVGKTLFLEGGKHQCQVGHERFQEMAVREEDNIRSSSEELPIAQTRNKSPSPHNNQSRMTSECQAAEPSEKANGVPSSPKEVEVVTIPDSPDANLDSEAIPQNKVAESSLPVKKRYLKSLRNAEVLLPDAIVQKSSESPKISRINAAFVDTAQNSVLECHGTELADKADGGSSSPKDKEVEATAPETLAANSDHEAVLEKAAAESSLPDVESFDCFPTFMTVSDKEEEQGLYKVDQHFQYTTGFEELTNFSFLNGQDSPYLPDLPNTEGMEEGSNSAAGFGSETGRFQFSAVCVWCQDKFDYEAAGLEARSNAVGFMCPVCKAKISGQFNMLDTGSSMSSFL